MKDNIAYRESDEPEQQSEQPGIRFNEPEQKEEITRIENDLNKRDKNWKWSVKIEDKFDLPFPESVIELHWEYLEYMEEPQDYFKITYDQEKGFFSVRNEHGEDITEELEDTTSLKEIMYSVFWYASSRY